MIRESMTHPLLLTILLLAGACVAQPFEGSGNETVLQHAPGAEDAGITVKGASASVLAQASIQTVPAAPANGSAKNSAHNLSYIWSVTGIEPGHVIMVLNQNGKDLYGSAKYEQDSKEAWNAQVIGTVDADTVELVINADKGDKDVASRLIGAFDAAGQILKGDFLSVSDGQIQARGNFEAIWINPDISSYTPASVTKTDENEASGTETNETSSLASKQYSSESFVQTTNKTSRYHDVHQYADSILTGVGDISQIPIGMGGSGLN
jgi:hypothetical protein